MAYLKQRLETLLGHDVRLMMDTHPEPWGPGKLVEVGEDYVGMDYGIALYLMQIAHVIHIQHSPRDCATCP